MGLGLKNKTKHCGLYKERRHQRRRKDLKEKKVESNENRIGRQCCGMRVRELGRESSEDG